MLFGFFPHPDCYIQVVNINFGWMSTNVSQVKPRYKDTKWLKCVPCQTEHVSIYASIWRSVRQCRCRYRANNNVWPPETNSLLTWWWNHEIFLEHIGILISCFWKVILESSLMFKVVGLDLTRAFQWQFQAMIFGQKRCSKFLVVLPTFHGNDTLTP